MPPSPPSGAPFTREELRHYGRHLLLPEVGVKGQERLKRARVLVLGVGGLGSPAALYLAAAGVGRLGLVDHDVVDPSNLHRQILFGAPDVGGSKLKAARARLEALNPHIQVDTHETRFRAENAHALLSDYDFLVDGSDNFPTRYLANDVAVLQGKPNVFASLFRFEGQVTVFDARRGPCYRCLLPTPPPPGAVPDCNEAGVLGVVPGILGALQAAEAIKLITSAGNPLVGRLLLVDALRMEFSELTLPKNPRCPLCGPDATLTELIDYEAFCAGPSSAPVAAEEIHVNDLEAALASGGQGPFLLDVRERHEWDLVHLPGATLIPLPALAARVSEVPTDRDIVVYCHHGGRSARAAAFLREQGRSARNLSGGIDAWAERVDPSLPRY